MNYRLGIDVGGTHTDAALLDSRLNCIATVKVATTADVTEGIHRAIAKLLEDAAVERQQIRFAMLGTTHCTNAIVERKGLQRVGLLRLARPATLALPPLSDWPQDLHDAVDPVVAVVHGGYEYDGRLLSEIDPVEISKLVSSWHGKVDTIAVCGVFANINNAQERQVEALIRSIAGPDIPITLSSEIGALGLLERENAAVLNAALGAVAVQITNGFSGALKALGMTHTVAYIGQNDGTLMSIEKARKYPVLTIGCGPTNSLRGAAFLSGYLDAIVVDVGGTTADVGVLAQGFPRQSSVAMDVGGIRTNFRMPDILSIGVGGGTVVRVVDGKISLGPDSVGYRLNEAAQVFGGDTLTLTDVSIAAGIAPRFATGEVRATKELCRMAFDKAMALVDEAVDRMKTGAQPVPVVLVGGGSVLLSETISGASVVVRPPHFDAANAIGVAIGDVSGEVDCIVDLPGNTRHEFLQRLRNDACERAVEAGADPQSTVVIQQEVTPLGYLPGQTARVFIKAAGKLAVA